MPETSDGGWLLDDERTPEAAERRLREERKRLEEEDKKDNA